MNNPSYLKRVRVSSIDDEIRPNTVEKNIGVSEILAAMPERGVLGQLSKSPLKTLRHVRGTPPAARVKHVLEDIGDIA